MRAFKYLPSVFGDASRNLRSSVEPTSALSTFSKLWLSACRLNQIIDAAGECVNGERLGYNLHPGFKVGDAENGRIRVACDEQDLEPRPDAPSRVRHLTAIHAARQSHVGDKKVEVDVGL